MRISLIIMFTSILSVFSNTYSQNKKFSFELNSVSLREVLREIEKNSDFIFLLSNEYIDVDKKVSVRADGSTVEDILDKVLDENRSEYQIKDRQIIIKKREIENALLQTRKYQVTGLVKDKDGTPIPGANIMVKGTTRGVVSNENGEFDLKLDSPDATIIISFVGYDKKEIKIAGRKSVEVVLSTSTSGLDEVVVVAYGSQKKANLTGAINTLDTKVIDSRPVNNVAAALQGTMPGLTVTRSSGQPGSEGLNLSVRGVTSVNSSGNTNLPPLVIVDGVEGDLGTLNLDDIESTSLIKDGAAAIYGARAAGGVLLITTKSGNNDKLNVEFKSSVGIKVPTFLPSKANSKQFMDLYNERNMMSAKDSMYTYESHYQYLGQKVEVIGQGRASNPTHVAQRTVYLIDNNLEDEFWDNGIQQNYNLSIGGGTKKSTYYFSMGMLDETGILLWGPDDFRKYNLRIKGDHKLTDWLTLRANINMYRAKRKYSSKTGGAISNYYGTYPFAPLYNPDGEYYSMRGIAPPQQTLEEGGTQDIDSYKVLGNFALSLQLTKELSFEAKTSLSYYLREERVNTPTVEKLDWFGKPMGYVSGNPNSRSRSYQKDYQSTVYAYLQYMKSIQNHNIKLMAGASHEEFDRISLWGSRQDFNVGEPFTLNTGNPDEQKSGDGGYHWSIESWFGRLNYDFSGKYLFEATWRMDGTSRFHPDHRWGQFKSFSAGWRLSEESFMEDFDWLTNAKLRVSHGEMGNQSNIGLYDYIPLISIRKNTNEQYTFGETPTAALRAYESKMVSLERKWETIVTNNAGIDIGLFNKLSFSYDYFIKYNNDLLLGAEYPAVIGASVPETNIGKLKTWGWEASVEWRDKISDFNYYVRFNISDSQNELVEYGGKSIKRAGTGNRIEGYPVNAIFGYRNDGFIQTEEELTEYKKLDGVNQNIEMGDVRFEDIDGDGKITANGNPDEGYEGDLEYLGSVQPRYNYSMNLGFSWKNIDFSAFIQGVGQRYVYRNDGWTVPMQSTWLSPLDYFYRKTWTPDNTDALYPKLTRFTDIMAWNWRASELRVEDAAYVRLKNIQIGYTLPKSWVKKVNLSSVRFYASGEDLWEMFDFKRGPEVDPESNGSVSFYPFTRTYSFGVNIKF